MNFCPKCQFMVYTKLSSDKKNLVNYCKNCSWEGPYINDEDDTNICVYQKNYSNDYIALKSLTSKYILHDPTLPRINNIECINQNCLTNKNFDETLTVHLKNIGTIHTEISYLTDFLNSLEIEESAYSITNINNNELLLVFKETSELEKLGDLTEKQEFDIENNNVSVMKYVKPNREIIFMKYDNANLKYLYMCSTCRTTWKTE